MTEVLSTDTNALSVRSDSWAKTWEPYGKGFRASPGSCVDAATLTLIQNYKRLVAKRYRVVEKELIEVSLPSEQLWVSTKIDGELWFLVKRGAVLVLVAPNGRVIRDIAMLENQSALQDEKDLIIAGELHVQADGRARSYNVGPALSDTTQEPNLRFSGFDVVSQDGADQSSDSYQIRLTTLSKLLPSSGALSVVPTETGTPSDVHKKYIERVEKGGQEGLVVRSERGLTYKIKPTFTVDLVILAFGERIVGNEAQLRELEVGLIREDGTFQLVGSVGGGFSEEDRKAWYARLSKETVPSQFRLANREGTLCRFVRPNIVIEVRVSDFLATDAWDRPIQRMSLKYDAQSGYSPLLETPVAVPIHPVFVRERTDKTVDVGNVGLAQIEAYIEQGGLDKKLVARAASERIARRVWTKETKGLVAVRKYVVLKTHKEETGLYAPFVIFFTDFSANRKEPLETELRTAADREGALKVCEAWEAENIKKGWAEVGG